eukprot:1857633-Rhodomonas_salina.1
MARASRIHYHVHDNVAGLMTHTLSVRAVRFVGHALTLTGPNQHPDQAEFAVNRCWGEEDGLSGIGGRATGSVPLALSRSGISIAENACGGR